MFQKSEKQHVASGISKDLRNILLIVSGMNSVLCFLEMIGSFRATYWKDSDNATSLLTFVMVTP